jgi:hypothetical protein
MTLPKPGKDPKFPQTLSPISLQSKQVHYSKKLSIIQSKSTLKKEACLTQANLVSVNVTARHCNV